MANLKWFVHVDYVDGDSAQAHLDSWCDKNEKLVDKVINIIKPDPLDDDDDRKNRENHIKSTVAEAVTSIGMFLHQDYSIEFGRSGMGQLLDANTSYYKRFRRRKEAAEAKAAAKEMAVLLAQVEKKLTTGYFASASGNQSFGTPAFWADEKKVLASKNHLAPHLRNDSSFREALAKFRSLVEKEASKTISRSDVPLKDSDLRNYVIEQSYELMSSYSGGNDADKGDRFVELVKLLGLFKKKDECLIFQKRADDEVVAERDIVRRCKKITKSRGKAWGFSKREAVDASGYDF
jgi:hypothetical protein